MSVALRGNGILHIHSSTWEAVQEVAREGGSALEYESRPEEERGAGDYGEYVLKDSARALAKALYKAIHAIETDRASKRLVRVAQPVSVADLRAVADIAVYGLLYVD